MRVAERGIGLLQVSERAFQRLAFAQAVPQHGVDESGLSVETFAAREFHRLVHRRVIRNAREPEHLVEREAQENLQRWFLPAPVGLARDDPVERGLAAHHAIDQFLQESAILRRHARLRERAFEQMFDKVAPIFSLEKQAHGNFPWFFKTHLLIICFDSVTARKLIL